MKLKPVIRTVSLTALTAFGIVAMSVPTFADDMHRQITSPNANRPVTAELKELRSRLDKLSLSAEQLEKLPHSQLSFRNHASKLNLVKDGVNSVGDQLTVLQAMQPFAEPWQQDAIAAILPIAVEVAERTGAAIVHLNGNQNYLWQPDYVDHLRTIPTLSNDMRDLIDNHLKVVENRENIQGLERKFAERVS